MSSSLSHPEPIDPYFMKPSFYPKPFTCLNLRQPYTNLFDTKPEG